MQMTDLPIKSIAEVEIPIPPIEIQHEIIARLFITSKESNNAVI